MTADDEKFFAWLDGELSGTEALKMEAMVAADPRLVSLAEKHRELSGRLRTAFGTVAEAPVPQRITAAMTRSEAEVVDFAAVARARGERKPPAHAKWAAMAAALVFGLALGVLLRAPGNAPFEVKGGGVYAAASLNQALDTQLASEPAASNVRIGLTFRDKAGGICRSFTAGSSAGLACRDKGRWRVRGIFDAPEGQSSEYRMAAGMNPSLSALLDATIASGPLDAEQERAAKQSGWR